VNVTLSVSLWRALKCAPTHEAEPCAMLLPALVVSRWVGGGREAVATWLPTKCPSPLLLVPITSICSATSDL
jgi:hypothetical protein